MYPQRQQKLPAALAETAINIAGGQNKGRIDSGGPSVVGPVEETIFNAELDFAETRSRGPAGRTIESDRHGEVALCFRRAADVDLTRYGARAAAGGAALLGDQVDLGVVEIDGLWVVRKERRPGYGGGARDAKREDSDGARAPQAAS